MISQPFPAPMPCSSLVFAPAVLCLTRADGPHGKVFLVIGSGMSWEYGTDVHSGTTITTVTGSTIKVREAPEKIAEMLGWVPVAAR